MKLIFTFENGTSRVTLDPENPRDKTLLSLLYPPGDSVVCKVTSPGDKGVVQLETTAIKKGSDAPPVTNG